MTESRRTLTRRDLDLRDRDAGYSQIGYHFVIERDGKVEKGRPLHLPSMHDPVGDSKRCVAVCLVGGADDNGEPEDNFTPQQKLALRQFLLQHPALSPRVIAPCIPQDVKTWLD